jgi:hypothetical protein
MRFISMPLLLILNLSIASPLLSQNADTLGAQIGKNYCDSLTQDLPLVYNNEAYLKVEDKWDRKIFMFDNPDIETYLKLNAQLKPKNGVLKSDVFLKIAQNAIKGCDFYMANFGKGSRNKDIKPSLIEVGDKSCTCLESKLQNMTYNEIFVSKQNEAMGIMQECSGKSLLPLREKVLREYEIKDQASGLRYGNLSSGYLLTNCPKFVNMFSAQKAEKWADNINWRIRRDYGEAAWNVVNATKYKVKDTLSNQFINVESFKLALPELRKAEAQFKNYTHAYSFRRPQDDEEIDNRTIQKFIFADAQKTLFQLVLEFETDAYGKLKSVIYVPRQKIKNLKELDEEIKMAPPPPRFLPPPPPPPMRSKN